MIKSISILNFRGIEEIKDLQVDKFNIFIGDNGTSKTTALEAIHFAFSPSFLSGKIKHTDFPNGNDNPIKVEVQLSKSIEVKLVDGYTEQNVSCDRVSLGIKKRERKAAGKVFSDLVTLEHIVLPDIARSDKGWKLKRKTTDTYFTFTERSLALSQVSTDELPRSFFYNKERDRQLQKGYNSSFSTIIEDLNYRFSKTVRKEAADNNKESEIFKKIFQLTQEIESKIDFDKHEVFKEFEKRTKDFELDDINLSIIDSLAPYESAFLSTEKQNLDLPIKFMGSGIEMIASLLLLETLASMAKENLLLLIDEPELHLHPKLQEKLAEYLTKISSGANGHQIFVTTHSPVFFKNCVNRPGVKTFITKRDEKTGKIQFDTVSFGSGLLPWSPSWGEINYIAYNYPTIEFHDELYGFIQERTASFTEKEIDDLLEQKFGIVKDRQWTPEKGGVSQTTRNVTLAVFIRNKIHHPENKTMQGSGFSGADLVKSIDQLITVSKAVK